MLIQTGEMTLKDYLAVLRRHRWLVAGTFGLVMLATIALTVITPPRFESTATVLLRTQLNTQVFPTAGRSQLPHLVRNPAGELGFTKSTEFVAAAEERFGTSATVTPTQNSNGDPASLDAQLIEFRASASDPESAAAAAQGWAELYLQQRLSASSAEMEAAVAGIQRQIEELEAEKSEILLPLAPLDSVIASQTDPLEIARLTSDRLMLMQELDDELLPVRFQIRTLSDDLGRLEIASDLAGVPGMSARINTAATPGRQVAPEPMRNLALGAVLGALLGVGAGLLNDSLRVRLGGRDDIELVAPDLTILAEIPPLPADEATAEQRNHRIAHYGAEIERVVSSVAYQAAHADDGLSVMVTSARLGEGKSTLVQQLAHRLTESYVDTVVLDADLRRPVLHNRFGITNSGQGLRDLLSESAPLEPHLIPVPDAPRLRLMPAGPATDAAAPLLRRSFASVVSSLDRRTGVLLVDSPPVLAVADAEIIANSVDRVVIVVRSNVTTRSELAQTIERLSTTRAAILGIVLVGVEPTTNSYGYGYGYLASPEANDAAPAAQVGPPIPPERVFERHPQPVITPVDAQTSAPAAADQEPAEPAQEPAGPAEQAPRENLADVIPLWLESPKNAEAEEDTAAAFSEAAATGTERPSPRPSSPAHSAGPPLSNSAARGLAPIRNRRPSNRPRPRPKGEPTIDLR